MRREGLRSSFARVVEDVTHNVRGAVLHFVIDVREV